MSILRYVERKWIKRVTSLMIPGSKPNLNELALLAKNARLVQLNIKALGYDLARSMAAALPPPLDTKARHIGLRCKPSIQVDIESDWTAHWAAQLGTPVLYHRKLWELAYVLQDLRAWAYARGCARVGLRLRGRTTSQLSGVKRRRRHDHRSRS